METPKDIWTACTNVLRGLESVSQPAFDQAAESAGLIHGEWRGWLLPAYLIQPDPISAAVLRIRNPYANASLFTQRLAQFTLRGFLVETESGYFLSETGFDTARALLAAGQSVLIQLNLPDASILDTCNQHLSHIRQACLECSEPHSKWCLEHNGSRDHGEGHKPICTTSQLLSDLTAWRDDCHLGAWQPYHYLHGNVWEVFTLFWQGQARTIDDIVQICSIRRGFNRDEYLTAIDGLMMRGWLTESEDGSLGLSPSGLKTRQAAEEYTDEMFYAPFHTLTEPAAQELLQALQYIEQQLTA